MTVDLPIFLLGLALLWFPRQWMRHRRRSAASTRILEPWEGREPGDPRVSFRTEFCKLRNYLDLFRGAAGSLMLSGGLGMPAAIAVGAGGARSAGLQLMALRASVLLSSLAKRPLTVFTRKGSRG